MKTVITYGTYDMLHYGHIRLLERAKKLGDYLIVGITSEDFDRSRGKINVRQSLMERIEAVKDTGIADQIIVEEYSGQKIDDIRRYSVDIFAIGSDWKGKFDYLNEYCKVVYLERTEGVSSTELRSKTNGIRLGIVGGGKPKVVGKYISECQYVNGLDIIGVYSDDITPYQMPKNSEEAKHGGAEAVDSAPQMVNENGLLNKADYEQLLNDSDAVYICSYPSTHYDLIKRALQNGKHVLCESPIADTEEQVLELYDLAARNELILVEAIKTAYSLAYSRLLLLIKGGIIGDVLSVDASCTSLAEMDPYHAERGWNSINTWGPTALLPILQILGTDYKDCRIVTKFKNVEKNIDSFTKVSLLYRNAVASIKVGLGVKTEGELVISGTKGYIYVPAPWWKTDYFEVRYEHHEDNKRFFYQLDGEGIRFELVDFIKSIGSGRSNSYILPEISAGIADIINKHNKKINTYVLL